MRNLCLAVTLMPSLAMANGYQNLHQSAEGMGTAYAANGAGISDISAMFSNPASLARFSGTNLSFGASLIMPTDSFEDLSASTAAGAPVTGTPAVPTQFLDTTVGGFAYLSYQLNPTTVLGFSFNAPWATESDYTNTAASRYTATRTALTAYNFGFMVGHQVNSQLSVGAALNVQYYDSEFATNIPSDPTNPSFETDVEAVFSGDNLAYGYTLGIEYQATPATRFGASYRSAITHDFEGAVALSSPTDNAAVLAGLAGAGISATGDASYGINTPWMLQLGAQHQASDKLELFGSATLTGWSEFKDTVIQTTNGLGELTVRNGWNDAWYVAVGAGYQINDRTKILGGIAFDDSPTVDDIRNPRAPNEDRIYAGLGVTHDLGRHGMIKLGYAHTFFDDAPIALTAENNPGRGTLNGNIKIDADILMLQYVRSF